MLPRTEMASTTLTPFPAAASRARLRTLVLICGIQPPGVADRPRGRLPAGAAEIVRGGFFTMATVTIAVI